MARVAVVGLGNIGSVFAAHLAAGGHHDVTACVRHPPSSSITVDSPGGEVSVSLPYLTDPAAAQSVDWVLLCLKSQDTAAALPWLERLCGGETGVAIVQNGVDHPTRLKGFRAVPTVVYTNSKRLGPGHVRHLRPQDDLGVPNSADGRALAKLFGGTGIRVCVESDFTTASWRKFLINVIANPLTAIAGRGIGVLRQPDMEKLAREMLCEAIAVGREAGAKLDPEAADGVLRWLAGFPGDVGTSMLEDRQAGKPLELEAITGALVRLGQEHGVATPVNAVILALMRGLNPQP